MVIGGYSINGYWWLVILLMAIGCWFFFGLLVVGLFINGY
jgi:hypothetical protein